MQKKKEFPWGTVVHVHTIKGHQITEFISGPTWDDAGQTRYYHEGSGIWEDFDEALTASLVVKSGNDPLMVTIIKRLLRKEGEE